MYDFSYECTKATFLRDLGHSTEVGRIVLAALEFEDEHGHALAPVAAAVVSEDGQVQHYVENLFSEDADIDDDHWNELSRLCEAGPSYDVYNPEDLAAMLLPQLPS